LIGVGTNDTEKIITPYQRNDEAKAEGNGYGFLNDHSTTAI